MAYCLFFFIAPVSFSIKKPKDEVPKEIKSALPVEESDDDHEDATAAKTPPILPVTVISDLPPSCSCYTSVTVAVSNTSPPNLSSTSSIITSARLLSKTPPLKEPSAVSVTTDSDLNRLQENEYENKDENTNKPEETEKIKSSVDSDDLILEMIDLTDDLEEKREMKRGSVLQNMFVLLCDRLFFNYSRRSKKRQNSCSGQRKISITIRT